MLERVWEKNKGIFRCIVGQVLFDRSSTEDVLQEAFTRVLQAKKAFTDEDEAHRYLRRVVFNTAIDHYRRFNRHDALVKSVSSLRQESLSPLTILIQEEEKELENSLLVEMRKALKSLSPKQKQAIDVMFSRNGQKLKEICREKNIPYSTLRSRLISAVDQIRKKLKNRGFNLDPKGVRGS